MSTGKERRSVCPKKNAKKAGAFLALNEEASSSLFLCPYFLLVAAAAFFPIAAGVVTLFAGIG